MSTAAQTAEHGEPIRVLLVDDHEHVLWGLSKLIDGEWPRMMVTGMCGDMAQARALIAVRKPDVVVLDIHVSGENTLEFVRVLAASNSPDAIVLTATRDADLQRRALLAGAKSVVDKEAPAEMLLREIERVHRERRTLSAAP